MGPSLKIFEQTVIVTAVSPDALPGNFTGGYQSRPHGIVTITATGTTTAVDASGPRPDLWVVWVDVNSPSVYVEPRKNENTC